MLEITIPEKVKIGIMIVAGIVSAIGFANLFNVISILPDFLDVTVTALSSLITSVAAYYTKVKDAVKNPK
jgi:mannose/fructose/N-acetylgalactosamine-specific phosphotransferase system component IIC